MTRYERRKLNLYWKVTQIGGKHNPLIEELLEM